MKLQLDWLDKQTHKHKIVIAGKSSPIIDYSFISLTAIIEGTMTCCSIKSLRILIHSALEATYTQT